MLKKIPRYDMVHLHKNATHEIKTVADRVNWIYLYNVCDLSSAKFDDFAKACKKVLHYARARYGGGRAKTLLDFFLILW